MEAPPVTNEQPLTVLHRFFSGLAEYTFEVHLGVADPPLIDYLSDLLARFVQLDQAYRIRDDRGRPLKEVAAMLVEAQQRQGDARREVHRHVGDFTLFWTGVFPEAVPNLKGRFSPDQLLDYSQQGKQAYFVASTIDADDPPADILERLSHNFELCAYGLREVRRQWEAGDEEGPRPFLIN